MAKTLSIAPPNAQLFISDVSGGRAPEFISNLPVLSTDTAISVSCLPNMDGETRVTLGAADEVSFPEAPIFDGLLKTPTNGIVVSTVEHEVILDASVPSRETRIRIWTNRTVEPDEIAIALGG